MDGQYLIGDDSINLVRFNIQMPIFLLIFVRMKIDICQESL